MKAVVYTRYGPPDVLRVGEVRRPVPGDDEVLVRICAAPVTAGDSRMRGFRVPPSFWLPARLFIGLRGPRRPVLGTGFAGRVEAVGRDVSRYGVGDAVFGSTGMDFGTHAEYKCVREDGTIARKPEGMSYEEAAAVPDGALTALYFLREKGKVRAGQRVLINGASGAVGSAAVQIARHFGAEVTGVCSAANAEMVRSLGAGRVIDYTREDFTREAATYDIIFDTVGKLRFGDCRGSLAEGGVFLATVVGLREIFQSLWTSVRGGRRVVGGTTSGRAEDMEFLRQMVEAGRLRSVIDRRYPLEGAAEAHRYVEGGHKRGNVVLTTQGA